MAAKDDEKKQIIETKEEPRIDILNKVEYIQLSLFNKFNKELQHAFFTRNGGVSMDEGIKSLNVLFSKEDHKNVFENRLRITQVMSNLASKDINKSQFKLISLIETHSNKVIHVTEDVVNAFNPPISGVKEADGMVTKLKNIILGIYAADCCPVFFYDTENKILGACHAGYKGALKGIANNIVKEMINLGSKTENIFIVIGPALQQKSLEVGIDFKGQFIEKYEGNEMFFMESEEKPKEKLLFDMVGYIKAKLVRDCGINEKNIECSDVDTLTDDRFYSYRRSKKIGEKKWGNHMSCVVMF
eukprot:367286_1